MAICSDCLFFDASRPHLVRCLSRLLRPSGRAIVVAPPRSGTREDFVRLARESGQFSSVDPGGGGSSAVASAEKKLALERDPRFDPDRHWPGVVELCKKAEGGMMAIGRRRRKRVKNDS